MRAPLTANERSEIRNLLTDGYTVSEVVRMGVFSRPQVDRVAKQMRAEGQPVMRCPQGRRPKA